VTRRVLIPGIERRHQRSREGEARPSEPLVRNSEVPGNDLFLLGEVQGGLLRASRKQEDEDEPEE
jgi:hypothetical protein